MTSERVSRPASFASVALGVVLCFAGIGALILSLTQVFVGHIEDPGPRFYAPDLALLISAMAAATSSLIFGGALAFEWRTRVRPLYWMWLVSWITFATIRGLLGFNLTKAALGTLAGVTLTIFAERATRDDTAS
jgi:hypothetical protein